MSEEIAAEINMDIEPASEYDKWLYRRRLSRLCAYFIIKTSLLILLIEKIF